MTDDRDTARTNRQPDVEAALRAIGARTAFPPTPDLWSGVSQQLQSQPAPGPGERRPVLVWRQPARRALVAAAIAVLVLAAVAITLPDVRTAIADRLGLTGVVIRLFDEPPTVEPIGTALDLGRPVSLAEAVSLADFPVMVPGAAGFGPPDEIYVTYGTSRPMVSFVYKANESLPASRYTGVGALVTQFRGHVEQRLIEKGVMSESAITRTTVGGSPAFWIDGASHFFLYRGDDGDILSEGFRLAGNVLLWERDGVTYRIEADISLAAAVEAAASMEPAVAAGTD